MRNVAYPIRPITDEEWPRLGELLAQAFLEQFRPEDFDVFRDTLELDRSLVAFDGELPVASAGAHTMSLTVPGAVAPAAGITMVTCHPTYRRRGLLTALMTRQLDELADQGEAVAILWASESSIYGRYGYAIACQRAGVDVERAAAGLVGGAPDDSHLTVRLAVPTEVRTELAKVYEELRTSRPGYVARNDAHWTDCLYDPEHARDGALAMQALLVSDGDDVRGYALFQVSPGNDGLVATGRVRIHELQAEDPAAYVACWRFLSTLDLTARVTSRQMPVDAPLFQLLADPRRARVTRNDALWARLVRVGDTLAQRRYAAPVDIVLDVVDERLQDNAGTWHLAGDESGATCSRTSRPADVRLDTSVLASAYLGDSTLTAHAVAGRVEEHRPGALRRLSAAMSWDPRPWCPHSF